MTPELQQSLAALIDTLSWVIGIGAALVFWAWLMR